jgi:hypothetical protein
MKLVAKMCYSVIQQEDQAQRSLEKAEKEIVQGARGLLSYALSSCLEQQIPRLRAWRRANALLINAYIDRCW